MNKIKNCICGMLFQRVLILAEYEENDIMQKMYIDFLRRIEEERND